MAHTFTFSFFERMLTRTLPSASSSKNTGHDHAMNCAQMIDQSFIVFREDPEFLRSCQAQTETGDSIVRRESHRPEKVAQQFDAATRKFS